MEFENNRPVDWDLLTRYVTGECSEPEEVAVETWAASDPEHQRLLEQLQNVWQRVDEHNSTLPVDVEAALYQLNQRIREEEDDQTSPRRNAKERPSQSSHYDSRRSRLSSAAVWTKAAPVIAVLAAALAFFVSKSWSSLAERKEFVTQPGQRAAIQLNDGTEVHLNVDSRLVLSQGGFSNNRREVRLEGEAYFDVKHADSRPFRVHTEDASVEVLGTEFNLKAYPQSRKARVAVKEGKVAVRPGHRAPKDTIVLRDRHVGVVSNARVKRISREADLSRELLWKKGKLVFENAPFDEVIRKLGRWYDLRIESEVRVEDVAKLNATLDRRAAKETIRAVATALDLEYRKEEKVIVFYR